jgi:hypothetical protein
MRGAGNTPLHQWAWCFERARMAAVIIGEGHHEEVFATGG